MSPHRFILDLMLMVKSRCACMSQWKTLLKLCWTCHPWESYNVSKMHRPEDPNVHEDVRDGKTFKENTLLQELPSSISVILYQGAFEVVNPLGSGENKHKLLAVHMTMSEVLYPTRSAIDPMQLVILCRESDYQFIGTRESAALLCKRHWAI